MRFHETPTEVARLLARHVPRFTETVLDPAVGHGALLMPVVSRLRRNVTVSCVDIDPIALAVAKEKLRCEARSLHCIEGDFLNVVQTSHRLRRTKFDCIVMNPPYAARKTDWCECDLSRLGVRLQMHLPKELTFVFWAAQLLRPGGRLLAILPGSMASSRVLSRFRESLGSAGRFHFVHELPKFTFPRVEGRVYLVVFERGVTGSMIELRNHDIKTPHRMSLAWNNLGPAKRLDYGFHHSRQWLNSLMAKNPTLG